MMTFMSVADAADLLRMEYAEMPGLALTMWQAQRLCNLSPDLCERALRTLLESGIIRRTADGRYTSALTSPTAGGAADVGNAGDAGDAGDDDALREVS